MPKKENHYPLQRIKRRSSCSFSASCDGKQWGFSFIHVCVLSVEVRKIIYQIENLIQKKKPNLKKKEKNSVN